MALLAAVTRSAWGGRAKPKDFVPDWWGERRQSVNEMLLVGMAFAAGTRAKGA